MLILEPVHEISNNVVCVTSKASDQQSDQSLCKSLEYSMIVKLLTQHHLKFLSVNGGCRASSESTPVKMSIVGNLMPRLIYQCLSLINLDCMSQQYLIRYFARLPFSDFAMSLFLDTHIRQYFQ